MKNAVSWSEKQGCNSSRGLIWACGWWCWVFRLFLTELMFHNIICDFTLSFLNNNCCFRIWSYTTKKVLEQLENNGWRVMIRWREQGSGRHHAGEYVLTASERGKGLGSFSSRWALWFLLQVVLIVCNKTASKKTNLVEYQSTARNIGQWRLSASSVMFCEALCSGLGGLLVSPCALVPNNSLGFHGNTWKNEWKRS